MTGGTSVGSWTESVRANVMAGSCFCPHRLRDHHLHAHRLRDRAVHGSHYKATGQ